MLGDLTQKVALLIAPWCRQFGNARQQATFWCYADCPKHRSRKRQHRWLARKCNALTDARYHSHRRNGRSGGGHPAKNRRAENASAAINAQALSVLYNGMSSETIVEVRLRRSTSDPTVAVSDAPWRQMTSNPTIPQAEREEFPGGLLWFSLGKAQRPRRMINVMQVFHRRHYGGPMEQSSEKSELASRRTEFAEDRTNFAEDRTVLANERTFAGWMRTGLASVGIGLGFNALFGKMEPAWIPKAIASSFVLSGMIIFYLAERNACAVVERLDSHSVNPVRRMNLRIVAGMMATGSIVLLIGLWFLI